MSSTGTTIIPKTSSTRSITMPPSSTISDVPEKLNKIIVIVGGIAGGVAVIAVALFGIFWLRKRHNLTNYAEFGHASLLDKSKPTQTPWMAGAGSVDTLAFHPLTSHKDTSTLGSSHHPEATTSQASLSTNYHPVASPASPIIVPPHRPPSPDYSILNSVGNRLSR